MNLSEKLLAIQSAIDCIAKDGQNTADKYNYASGTAVLSVIRPLMNEHRLLLVPRVTNANLHEGVTKSGTTRFMTEIFYDMVWMDVESGETLCVPSYAQGVDLAGERSVGKAGTYNEKIFLLKFFHIPTDKDDPDSDGRTADGEKKLHGTQGGKESLDMQKGAIAQILNEIYGADDEKKKAAVIYMTKNDGRGYKGVESVESISAPAIPVVYSKLKAEYKKRIGKDFEYKTTEDNSNAD